MKNVFLFTFRLNNYGKWLFNFLGEMQKEPFAFYTRWTKLWRSLSCTNTPRGKLNSSRCITAWSLSFISLFLSKPNRNFKTSKEESISYNGTTTTVFSALTMWRKLLFICSSAALSVKSVGSTWVFNRTMQMNSFRCYYRRSNKVQQGARRFLGANP